MRTIWKWRLDQMENVTRISVPAYTRFVAAEVEPDSVIAIWGECDSVDHLVMRDIYVVETGALRTKDALWVATVRSISGMFVWHVYAGPER